MKYTQPAFIFRTITLTASLFGLVLVTACLVSPAMAQTAPCPDSPAVPVHYLNLDSYEKIRDFIHFMDIHAGQTVLLNIKAAPPFAGDAWAGCGPLLWENPEHITGTQICFKNKEGEWSGECFEEKGDCHAPEGYSRIRGQIRIHGLFKVSGQIDRGRHGIWTYGLSFQGESPCKGS